MVFRDTGVSITTTEAPLGFLANQIGLGFLGQLIAVGALASFFACTLGCINPAARIFFLMARHGLFSSGLGKTHSSNRTPHIAVTMCSLIIFLVPTLMSMFGVKLFESMGYLGAICAFGFLTVYVLISLAAPVYLHRIGKLRPLDLVFSFLGVSFMMLPILGSIGISGNSFFPVPPAPYNVFPYLFLVYLSVTCGWFIWQRFRSPHVVRSMEQGIAAINARFDETNPKYNYPQTESVD
jgi:amino acid transporter